MISLLWRCATTVRDLPQAFLWLVFTFISARGAFNNYYETKERNQ